MSGACGQALIVVESPLQLLNAIEACEEFGLEATGILIAAGGALGARGRHQIEQLLADVNSGFVYWGDMQLKPGSSDSVLQEMDAITRRVVARPGGDGSLVMIGGEYRSDCFWVLVKRLKDRVRDVIIVDDGSATLRIDRRVRSLRRLAGEVRRQIRLGRTGISASRRRSLIFFSAYQIEAKLSPRDTYVRNSFPLLRSGRFASAIEFSGPTVVVVGSPLAEAGVMHADDSLDMTLSLLKLVDLRFPGWQVCYFPHRRESKAKIDFLQEVVDVRYGDLPLEMVVLGRDDLAVVGFYSSTLENLARMESQSTMIAVVPPSALVDRKWRRFINRVFDMYRTEFPEFIEVVDSECLRLPAERGI